jgi:uncharacterized protein (TIGR03437 family)
VSQPAAAPLLSGLSCTPASITAPGAAACTITLSAPSLAGGFSVTLASNNSSVGVPATVTVPAAASSVGFTATVAPITTNQTAALTASANGASQTATLSLASPAQLSSVSCSPATLGTGQTSTCTVTLNQAALSTATVSLSSSTGLLTVPASMTIATSASAGTFTATAGTVSSSQTAALTATTNGQSTSTPVSLTASASLTGLSCSPSSVNAPGTPACTVTLSGAAPSSGLAVALSSNNAYASVPGSVTVKAGSSSAIFTATVATVSTAQTATLTATAGAVTQTFSLSIAPAAWSISGAITPSSFGSGVTVTLSGGATATADSSGNYTFSGLVNGTYTLTPSRSGYTFTPPTQSVTVSGANLISVNFTAVQNLTTGTITVDTQVRHDQARASYTVTSPTFSTAASNELLLALVATGYRSTNNTSVRRVSGGGLTWVLVARTQGQKGTAEIWRAFSPTPLSSVSVSASLSQGVTSSITVMSFAGVDTSGTNGSGAMGAIGDGSGSTGAPTATLTTTRSNSFVVGVGNDPKTATSRTPGPNQTLVHQYLDPAGNTYWVQMLSNATPLSGSSVTINDSAPTADPYNLSIAEILAAPSTASQTTAVVLSTAMTSAPVIQTAAMAAASQTAPAQSSSGMLVLSNLAGGAVTNACSPGGLAALTGTGLTSQTPQTPTSFPLPTQLAGLQVMVNGIPAPLLFASDSQVRFQCPMLPSGTPLDITLEGPNGLSLASAASVMQPADPELFTSGATNQGVVLLGATNELALLNNQAVASRPARAGETLTIYASGLGDFAGNVPVGTPAPPGAPILLLNRIRVVVGGVEIDPVFAGLAPGTVGLSQVDVQLPRHVPTGPAVPLYIEVILPDGTVVESNEVTVAIQ